MGKCPIISYLVKCPGHLKNFKPFFYMKAMGIWKIPNSNIGRRTWNYFELGVGCRRTRNMILFFTCRKFFQNLSIKSCLCILRLTSLVKLFFIVQLWGWSRFGSSIRFSFSRSLKTMPYWSPKKILDSESGSLVWQKTRVFLTRVLPISASNCPNLTISKYRSYNKFQVFILRQFLSLDLQLTY